MVEIFLDSQLVVSQVKGSFEAKNPLMAKYLKMVSALLAGFQKAKVSQISRGKNSHADSLATLASSLDNFFPRIILVEVLEKPSIEHQLIVSVVSVLGPSWMDSIIVFLSDSLVKQRRQKRYEEFHLGFGCVKIGDCTNGHFGNRIYYFSIPRRWTAS